MLHTMYGRFACIPGLTEWPKSRIKQVRKLGETWGRTALLAQGRDEMQANRDRPMSGTSLQQSSEAPLMALNYILEAWEEGTDSGVASELMAYAALYAALTDLVASYGEDAVASLTTGLGSRVKEGEFTLCGTRQ